MKKRVLKKIFLSILFIAIGTINYVNASTSTCNANFSYSVRPNGVVVFTDLSTNVSTRLWNFGDGTTSTTKNPIHIYAAGIYTVNVSLSIVTTTGETCTVTKAVIVRNSGCTADFTYEKIGIGADPLYRFTDVSSASGTITSRTWKFGTDPTSYTGSPIEYRFAAGLTYVTVTLSIQTNTGCSASIGKTFIINSKELDGSDVTSSLPASDPELLINYISDNKIDLSLSEKGDYNVSVINTTGNVLLNNKVHFEKYISETVNLGNIPLGIYILKLQNNTNTIVKKIYIK